LGAADERRPVTATGPTYSLGDGGASTRESASVPDMTVESEGRVNVVAFMPE
jgi:hypothetical protein